MLNSEARLAVILPPDRRPLAAIPGEDPATLGRRCAGLEAEFAGDGSVFTRVLAHRVAALTVRLDRCTRFDAAMTAHRVRVAVAECDAARAAEAARHLAGLDVEPDAARAALLATPEGINLLMGSLQALRDEAIAAPSAGWTADQAARLARRIDLPSATGESVTSDPVASIDAAIARLQAHAASLDCTVIDRERAEAADRALVAVDPAATLTQRYEASTERSICRALREIERFKQTRIAPADPTPLATATAKALATSLDQLARVVRVAPTPAGAPPLGSFGQKVGRPTEPPLGSFGPGPIRPPGPVDAATITIARPAAGPQARSENQKPRHQPPR